MIGLYVINSEGYGRLVNSFDSTEEDKAYLAAYNSISTHLELYTIVNLDSLPKSIAYLDMLRLAGNQKAKYLIKELREARNGYRLQVKLLKQNRD